MADKPELTKEYIRKMVSEDNRWAARAILALYKFQTEDEQSAGETVHENEMGFNGIDAPILSSFAQQLLNGHYLSPKQLTIAKKRLGKYAGQLLSIALAKKDA